MKYPKRLVSAVLLAVVMVLTGCTTTMSRASRMEPVVDFTVVESSTANDLTPAQLAELRQAVINYLEEQGLAANRLYYVKVTFPTANPAEEPQWAVVRIGNLPARTYTVLAAYPGPDDSYPYDYYPNGYYTNYAQFARFNYYGPFGYYDPFDCNYGYITRPPRRDHKPDDRPGDKPDHPRTTPTGWENNRPDPDQPRWRDRTKNSASQPPVPRDRDRPDNPSLRNGTRNRPDDGDRNRDSGGSRGWSRERSTTSGGGYATPAPAYTPPPAPVRADPPPRSESSSQTREDKRSLPGLER